MAKIRRKRGASHGIPRAHARPLGTLRSPETPYATPSTRTPAPQAPEAPQAPYFSRRVMSRPCFAPGGWIARSPRRSRHGRARGAAFGIAALDSQLGGGLPRGQVSELTGPQSSGRTSLAWTWLGAATRRGEAVALIDTFDRFDPLTAARCGLDLSRVLWVRGQAVTKTAGALDPAWLPGARAVEGPGTLLERTIDRALKALNLVLQSGVCTAVVLDIADVPLAGIRRVPPHDVDAAAADCRRQRDGVSADGPGGAGAQRGRGDVSRRARVVEADGRHGAMRSGAHRWQGQHDRARRLAGLSVAVRMGSPRWTRTGVATLVTITRDDARAVE